MKAASKPELKPKTVLRHKDPLQSPLPPKSSARRTSVRVVRFAATPATAEEDLASLIQVCAATPDHWRHRRRLGGRRSPPSPCCSCEEESECLDVVPTSSDGPDQALDGDVFAKVLKVDNQR